MFALLSQSYTLGTSAHIRASPRYFAFRVVDDGAFGLTYNAHQITFFVGFTAGDTGTDRNVFAFAHSWCTRTRETAEGTRRGREDAPHQAGRSELRPTHECDGTARNCDQPRRKKSPAHEKSPSSSAVSRGLQSARTKRRSCNHTSLFQSFSLSFQPSYSSWRRQVAGHRPVPTVSSHFEISIRSGVSFRTWFRTMRDGFAGNILH